MLITIHGVRLFACCFKRSEVIHSLLYMELSYMLSAHCYTWRLFAHTNTWSEALCSMLYKGEISCSLLYKGESSCSLLHKD